MYLHVGFDQNFRITTVLVDSVAMLRIILTTAVYTQQHVSVPDKRVEQNCIYAVNAM